MKVGIITIYDLMNYGNRLQNYATIYSLRKIGIDGETVILHVYHIKRILKDFLRIILKKPIYLDWNIKQESRVYIDTLNEIDRKKYDVFRDFSYTFTEIKHRYYLSPFSFFLDKKYDSFFVGSDQVWNPYVAQAKEWEFLNFASKGKRNSWAASFGVSEIGVDKLTWMKKHLNQMDNISVREESGADLIKKMTSKEANILIDPTLMLDKSEWMSIANKPCNIDTNDPYILTYFLGKCTEKASEIICSITKEQELNIHKLNDPSQPDLYVSGPSEFLYLIEHANLVLTDSFHACVFSFLFGKPFLVYERKGKETNMLSRIESFLKMFHLEKKFDGSGIDNDLFEADYTEGYKQLEIEREKALKFLKDSLNIGKGR